MATALESLVEMGFPRNRAEKALAVTSNQGAQVAMDWLFAHQDDLDIDEPFSPPKGHTLGAAQGQLQSEEGQEGEGQEQVGGSQAGASVSQSASQQPQSLKCDDCGKQLKSELDVQAHAARTGHQNFSESTETIRPPTEEEKKAQLAKLEEKIKQKRIERGEQEKKNQIQREKMRRKTGKEMTEIKQQIEQQEAKKIAEMKKREKMEEKLAKQKVREQIARDRAERAAREEVRAGPAPPQIQPGCPQTQVGSPQTKREYDTCRLQIRLLGGGALTLSLTPSDTLQEVQRHISQAQQQPELPPSSLMTNFPKRVFSAEDMGRTLKELGLVPSAVLIQTKQ